MPRMPSEALLLGIAQMSVVIAGFTAVTSVLTPPGGAWSPGLRIRHRAIVSTSFNVMFEALVPLLAFAALADERASLVLASAVVAVYATGIVALRFPQFLRAGGYRTRSGLLLMIMGPAACLLFALNALVFASVAVYALALCVQLSVAVVSFYTLVAAAMS
jgi:hypothetical protein